MIGSSCDESDETIMDEEEIRNLEEIPLIETKNAGEAKQTLDELLSEIGNTK